MPYEFYKVAHLFLILIFYISAFRIGAKSSLGDKNLKKEHMALGISSLLILVAGFGLMARIGVSHQGWPLWIYLKLGIWLVLAAATPLVLKRFPRHSRLYLTLTLVFYLAASTIAVLKPALT